MKLSNGELEITAQQADSMVKNRGAVLRNNLRNWIDNFVYRQWDVTTVPATTDSFIRAEAFYNDIMRELEQIYRAHKDDATAQEMTAFCKSNIEKLKKNREKTRDKIFTDYQVMCWIRVLTFVMGLTSTPS